MVQPFFCYGESFGSFIPLCKSLIRSNFIEELGFFAFKSPVKDVIWLGDVFIKLVILLGSVLSGSRLVWSHLAS